MAGDNQHHIPQFLQRGFGIKPKSGKPKDIWVYARDAVPTEPEPIRKTASGFRFYSDPAPDGSQTLDDKITETESPLAIRTDALRALGPGSTVVAEDAAELILSLVPRAGHMRSAMTAGLQRLAALASPVFSDPDMLEHMVGLDEDEPGERFREKIAEGLAENPQFLESGLPLELLERVGFYIAKERFEETIAEHAPAFQALFEHWSGNAGEVAKEGHNRALEKPWSEGERYQSLASLHWTVEDAPNEGAVLPDCLAIAEDVNGARSPLLMTEGPPQMVMLPISTKKILVGKASQGVPFDATNFNVAAAAASHDFFLAHRCAEDLVALVDTIGVQSMTLFEEAVTGALSSHAALPDAPVDGADEPPPIDFATFRPGEPQSFEYALSLPTQPDDETSQRITGAVNDLVKGLSHHLPLGRLDGITFANDYPTALRDVDRGDPDLRPIETTPSEIGTGFASTVTVRRGDTIKGHVVVQAGVAQLLIDSAPANYRFALHALIYQLAKVAYIDLGDRNALGMTFSPITHPLQNFLFPCVDAGIQAYYAAFASAPFSDEEEVAERYRELLLNALARLTTVVDAARLAYRYTEDIDALVATAMPEISFVLQFAATLLGHCEASGVSITDGDGRLLQALKDRGLEYWLADFAKELERWRQRAGRWESLREFLAFSRQVERILWAVGMFPWLSPSGLRIEIPLARDAEALLAAQAPPESEENSAGDEEI